MKISIVAHSGRVKCETVVCAWDPYKGPAETLIPYPWGTARSVGTAVRDPDGFCDKVEQAIKLGGASPDPRVFIDRIDASGCRFGSLHHTEREICEDAVLLRRRAERTFADDPALDVYMIDFAANVNLRPGHHPAVCGPAARN